MFVSESIDIASYLDYVKFQKRYSQHTVISYQTDLTAFYDYLDDQFDISALTDINTVMIRSWLASLKETGNVSRTINRKISTLRSYFRYQLKLEKISSNPTVFLKALKVNRRLPSFLGHSEVDTLFRYVDFPDNWEGKTERLLLTILYNTGLRLSELINLKISDVDRGNSTLRVLGKGQKERIVPISSKLIRDIMLYEEEKTKLSISKPAVLLCNIKGTKLYPKLVYRAVKKYLGMVTTTEKKSPHVLRHTFATHLTNNGAGINAVKDLLGHASLASTQVYTHNSIEKLKDIHRLAHPKSS